MSTLILDISISLDGYATAAGVSDDAPMGVGGERLHKWGSGDDPEGRKILDESNGRVGATIAGRRTYDRSIPFWGSDGPGGQDRTPTIIVSHSVPDDVPTNGVYTFVSSLKEAVKAARQISGERPMDVFSPTVGRQLLQDGMVDELRLHVSPVIFGGGINLFEGIENLELELLESRPSTYALHLHYAVKRS
jgi:dihydrofolate reductase